MVATPLRVAEIGTIFDGWAAPFRVAEIGTIFDGGAAPFRVAEIGTIFDGWWRRRAGADEIFSKFRYR